MSFFAPADVCMFVARTGHRPINVHLFHLPSSLDFEVSLGFGSPEKEVVIFCVPQFSLRRLRRLRRLRLLRNLRLLRLRSLRLLRLRSLRSCFLRQCHNNYTPQLLDL